MNHSDRDDPQLARAVIRDGRITITRRPMFLQRERTRSYSEALRNAGTVVCDIELSPAPAGERELTVFPPIGDDLDRSSIEALTEWAAMIGCCRVWLPDSLIEIDDTLVPDLDDISVEPCTTCGVTPDPRDIADAIASRRRRGHSSDMCPVCSNYRPERVRRSQRSLIG